MTNATHTQTGFQMMMAKRAGMQNTSHIRTLLNHGSNREAAAIVESFQMQIDFEESECVLNAA